MKPSLLLVFLVTVVAAFADDDFGFTAVVSKTGKIKDLSIAPRGRAE